MEQEWHSVEQVAERLGLHVRTVRGYIRDGRLKAVRIGKQYRIARADLDTFTGRPAENATARPRAEASAVVELDGVTETAADRLSTLLVAGAQLVPSLRLQTIYDAARARLKVIVLGDVAATADVLHTIDDILSSDNDMLSRDNDKPRPESAASAPPPAASAPPPAASAPPAGTSASPRRAPTTRVPTSPSRVSATSTGASAPPTHSSSSPAGRAGPPTRAGAPASDEHDDLEVDRD
jgi:excisionase family DNA binding protein